jgi:hypothetical protein
MGIFTIVTPVSPVDHTRLLPLEQLSMAFWPEQMADGPWMTGVGADFRATVTVFVLVQPRLFVTVTV